MKSVVFVAIALAALSGCAPKGPTLEVREMLGSPIRHVGVVVTREQVEIDSGESGGKRAAIGALSGGIIGAAAASSTEKDISKSRTFRYRIRTSEAVFVSVLSFSIAEPGACVQADGYSDEPFAVLQLGSGCEPQAATE